VQYQGNARRILSPYPHSSDHVDRGEITVSVADEVDEAAKTAVSAKLEEETGYKLVVG